MNDRDLIRTGIASGSVAEICCAKLVLVVLPPLVGPSTWLARADWMALPTAVSLGLIAWGLYRRHSQAACCE
ncbi:mercury transport protein [Mesorhizobium sp. L-8-3]|uniref:mercury transport protein n=1 Tax=Mesorhizobium sp. L-8-3 TaxID=2744522 RepID=UPI0019274542|nr:mercury transport protein [Mesorhizobium sp. L-8-3]BCH24760.1 hypothetical protein MesoLjLb_45450 [Mesorhizobium sp. L-8-3]